MTTITISPTGRLTIPDRISRKMGWEPGTRLHVLVRDEEIALRPDRTHEDAPTALSATTAPTGRIIVTGRLGERLGWEPSTKVHVLLRDEENEIAIRRDLRVRDLGGIFWEHAIPGMTWEKEREAMYEYVADVHRKKHKRIAREYRQRQRQNNG